MDTIDSSLIGKYCRVRLEKGVLVTHGITKRRVRSLVGVLTSTGEISIGVRVGSYTTQNDPCPVEVVHVVTLDLIESVEPIRADTRYAVESREWYVEAEI